MSAEIELTAVAANTRVRAFYERQGFGVPFVRMAAERPRPRHGDRGAVVVIIVRYAVEVWRVSPERTFSAWTRTPTSIDVRHTALTRARRA